jgi:D-alanine-D-alanine ligase
MIVVETCMELPVLLVYGIDPSWTETEREEADRESRRLGHALRRQGHSVNLLPVRDSDLRGALSPYKPSDVVVFNWCEGVPGLNGSEALVAKTLERLRFTYTGSTHKTLSLSYDKARVKRRLEARGVPTPKWKVLTSPDANGWDCFPAIVKPAREHCSIGVDEGAVVSNADELRRRTAYVLDTFQQPALIEDFIDGSEFHVPLWGSDHLEMLPPVEMDFSYFDDFHERLCSYDAKFTPESKAYQKIKTFVPARLNGDEMAKLEEVSKAAYLALGCRDYGRIDVRTRDGIFYVLDVNPNADISADASVALAAGKAGYCYGKLGSRVLEFAARRHPQRLSGDEDSDAALAAIAEPRTCPPTSSCIKAR